MKIIRDNKPIRLTKQEIEAAYWERQKEYRIEDAESHCIDYLSNEKEIVLKEPLGSSDYEWLADKYASCRDSNLAENDIWRELVSEYIEKLDKASSI